MSKFQTSNYWKAQLSVIPFVFLVLREASASAVVAVVGVGGDAEVHNIPSDNLVVTVELWVLAVSSCLILPSQTLSSTQTRPSKNTDLSIFSNLLGLNKTFSPLPLTAFVTLYYLRKVCVSLSGANSNECLRKFLKCDLHQTK